uniref:Uncharacterized protein n=1 Tax=Oryza barthii TaxID=65489 RepID=A0A0G2KBM8_9ORYZ
MVGALEGQI